MALFRVEMTYVIYVSAPTDTAAVKIAEKALTDDRDGCGDPETFATAVTNLVSVPPDWRDALPFCAASDNSKDQTISEILGASNGT